MHDQSFLQGHAYLFAWLGFFITAFVLLLTFFNTHSANLFRTYFDHFNREGDFRKREEKNGGEVYLQFLNHFYDGDLFTALGIWYTSYAIFWGLLILCYEAGFVPTLCRLLNLEDIGNWSIILPIMLWLFWMAFLIVGIISPLWKMIKEGKRDCWKLLDKSFDVMNPHIPLKLATIFVAYGVTSLITLSCYVVFVNANKDVEGFVIVLTVLLGIHLLLLILVQARNTPMSSLVHIVGPKLPPRHSESRKLEPKDNPRIGESKTDSVPETDTNNSSGVE